MQYFPKMVYNLPPYVFNLLIVSLGWFFISLNGFHLFLSETIKVEKLRGKETSDFSVL